MRLYGLWKVLTAMILLASAGCNTEFSSEWMRQEIVRQTGAQPGSAFEFDLEGATMKLAQAAVSTAAGKPANFGGLTRIDLAIFGLPSGRPVGFDNMRYSGWDKFIRTQEGMFNLLVLVRGSGDSLADLTIFAQGEDQLLFGRLTGNLDSAMPSALPGVLRTRGLQGLKEHLLSGVGEGR
jgi:hypothetical protein